MLLSATRRWGSVEYGVADTRWTSGQVTGGRWKPLHHWLTDTLYRDVLVGCGADGRCFARNDAPLSRADGTLTLHAVELASGTRLATPLGVANVTLPRGAGAMAWVCLDGSNASSVVCESPATVLAAAGCEPDGSDCAVEAELTGVGGGAAIASNVIFMAMPSVLRFATRATVSATVGTIAPDGASIPVNVTVSGGAALFVTLTTLAQGRFERNAAPITPEGVWPMRFVPLLSAARGGLPLDAAELSRTLRIEHLALYYSSAAERGPPAVSSGGSSGE